MFRKDIRSDLMDENDLAELLADQRVSPLLQALNEAENSEDKKTISIDFNELLSDIPESNVMDIDEIKDKFNEMTSEIAEVVREALVLASSGRNLVADATWRPLQIYDRAGKCPKCEGYFPLNQISNNKKLVKLVRSDFAKLRESLPTPWNQENRTVRLFSKEKQERLGPNQLKNVEKKAEDSELQTKRTSKVKLNWEFFRSALKASGIEFEQNKGPMKRSEMISLYEADSDWGMLAAGLILCDRRSLCCPHKGCHADLWSESLESERPFHKISYEATRVILEETIGSPTARAPLAIDATVDGTPLKLRMGEMVEDKSRNARKLIAEAVLSATSVLGDITIKGDKSFANKINISHSDSEMASKIYTTPNHNIVTSLAKIMHRIRPIEAFVRDGRSVTEHHNWATSCAGQILHAIHQSGCLFKIEKTGSWTYSTGQTGNHATNLVRLNNDIQEMVVRNFVSTMADGEKTYNSLETMLSKETTPPMICKPLDRSADKTDEGGFLTVRARRKYPLITQSPQYNAFDANRFTPSDEAVNAVNTLQSTEWAVDHEMVEIANNTINNHIREDIVANLLIRKMWQVRRHYFSEEDGKPILNNSGNAKTYAVSGKEFDSKEEAEEYVSTSEASSETCSEAKANRMKHNVWNEQIHETYYIDFDETKPSVTFGQVNSWLNTFEFIKRLRTNYPDMKFWHAWHFDWRGRIMPVSTMLSPQNDDFSRGIITFAKSQELTESGRKWIGRVVASIYRGQTIPESFEGEERNSLKELMDKLNLRTYEAYDEVSSSELFQKMLRVIAEDPEANFASWGEGDVFRAKAEGLQRIALTREFVSILEQGENATTRLPINLDASSSIYQHASGLMLDSEMASKVNVLPNSSGRPSDVYLEVVDNLKQVWSGNPFAKFEVNTTYEDSDGKKKTLTHIVDGLDDETAEKLKDAVLVRNMAKKPVMTIGYGAASQSMVRALLTDNNEEKGKHGGFVAYHLGENWPQQVEDVKSLSKREYRKLVTAHPSSTIGIICKRLEIPNYFHSLIAQKVINGYTQSIEEVLPGYKKMKKSLQEICSIHLENNKENDSNLTWVVKDGCEISNVYFADPKIDSIGAWGGMDSATKAMRNVARNNLPENSQDLIPMENLAPVEFEKLSDVLDQETYDKLRQHEETRVSEIVDALSESNIDSDSINFDKLIVDWAMLAQDIGVGDSIEDIIDFSPEDKESKDVMRVVVAVRNYSGNFNVYFSRNILSDERDFNGERRGIAPNFIHSLDACHMRMVVNGLARKDVTDVWSVHDAFGCHPNHIEDLRLIVNQTFKAVHDADEDGRGILAKLCFEVTGKELEVGDMNLSDIVKLVDGELVSKYLIS
jgi:hypothetical protein